MKQSPPPQNQLFGLTEPEIREVLNREFAIEEKFRARQIYLGMYAKRARSFNEITDIPKALAEKLNAAMPLATLKLLRESRSVDGTIKFLFELEDGRDIET